MQKTIARAIDTMFTTNLIGLEPARSTVNAVTSMPRALRFINETQVNLGDLARGELETYKLDWFIHGNPTTTEAIHVFDTTTHTRSPLSIANKVEALICTHTGNSLRIPVITIDKVQDLMLPIIGSRTTYLTLVDMYIGDDINNLAQLVKQSDFGLLAVLPWFLHQSGADAAAIVLNETDFDAAEFQYLGFELLQVLAGVSQNGIGTTIDELAMRLPNELLFDNMMQLNAHNLDELVEQRKIRVENGFETTVSTITLENSNGLAYTRKNTYSYEEDLLTIKFDC